MNVFYGLVLVCYLSLSTISPVEAANSSQENSDYTVAVIVWGHSETPLAQDITVRLRKLGFNVADPTIHGGSRYPNYTDRVEVRYTNKARAKMPLILTELESISGLTVESKLFGASEDQPFSLAGDIQIQFSIILP